MGSYLLAIFAVSVKAEESHIPTTTRPNIRSPTPRDPTTTMRHHQTSGASTSALTPTVYKYIRNKAGVIGSITNPAGVVSSITDDVTAVIGSSHAEYLDAHGFGFDEVEHIVDAFYTAINIHEFTSLAAGCGMAVVELEWFWALS